MERQAGEKATMGKTLDLGLRVELLSTDQHCHDISLGLYRQVVDETPRFTIHSYSRTSGVEERIAYLNEAMKTTLGLEEVTTAPAWLQFPCRRQHLRPLKRAFLDLCKLKTGTPLEAKPLTAFDKKAETDLTVVPLGNGSYRTTAASDNDKVARRVAALARGFVKLCEMEVIEGENHEFRFPCGQDHHALLAQMTYRAQNVRATMREQEQVAARGTLSAPSQQN
jgi:hypothetical protein